MENAVKALLIAAAVLVAILLISLGVGIFNSASEQMEGADLSEYQIQQFNDKFKKYEGTSKSGSDVNALLDTVFSHNNSQEDNSTGVKVVVSAVSGHTGIAASNSLASSPTKVSTGARYKVTCKYNSSTKLIEEITVAKPGT